MKRLKREPTGTILDLCKLQPGVVAKDASLDVQIARHLGLEGVEVEDHQPSRGQGKHKTAHDHDDRDQLGFDPKILQSNARYPGLSRVWAP
jgi:hypothetical protein